MYKDFASALVRIASNPNLNCNDHTVLMTVAEILQSKDRIPNSLAWLRDEIARRGAEPTCLQATWPKRVTETISWNASSARSTEEDVRRG